MNLQDLRDAQAIYTERMEDVLKERNKLYKKRDSFSKYFTINKINSMHINEYVIGINKKAFCRRLERELDGLGRILGSNAFKFGVYFGRTKQDSNDIYRNSKIWGDNYISAYDKIKPALIKLINDGKNKNIDGLIKSKISPTFKGFLIAKKTPEIKFDAES